MIVRRSNYMMVERGNETALILLWVKCRGIGKGVHSGTQNHQAQQKCRDSTLHRFGACPTFNGIRFDRLTCRRSSQSSRRPTLAEA
jgi:hypothetical protein